MKSEELYKWVRTAGLLGIIPIVLATGPLAGYFLGDLLVAKYAFPGYTIIICVALGFLASAQETIKIIKIALKTKE